jgi:hypothetical protein
MNGPSDMLQQLLQSGALQQSLFDQQSRYYRLRVASLATADGGTISYVSRRFIPRPESFAVLQRHRVIQGERVDVVAAQAYGDPLLYWRLCDANLALRPEDVTAKPGAFIYVTLASGIPGN